MGADPNARAHLYGGSWRTMGLVVSSSHPARAGVQTELIDVLVDFGASMQGDEQDSPLLAALIHGYPQAAEALVRRGAPIDRLAIAAGLGRLAKFAVMLPNSGPQERHQALALAAQLGHEEIVRLLLDAGEDVNRFNPPGFHAHSTPLHQAVLAGHEDIVRLLMARGARLDIEDTIHRAVPLGWADHGGQRAIADFLRSVSR
jgi:ankyrin repeat protein